MNTHLSSYHEKAQVTLSFERIHTRSVVDHFLGIRLCVFHESLLFVQSQKAEIIIENSTLVKDAAM